MTGSIHAHLVAEHDEIDGLLDRLIQAFDGGDRDAAAAAYQEVERRLAAHFRMEEEHLLPEFARVQPREAETLVAEHRALRARIEELAIGVQLHQTTRGAIEELAKNLRAHAVRENTVLYPWADRGFSDAAHRAALEEALSHLHSPEAGVH